MSGYNGACWGETKSELSNKMDARVNVVLAQDLWINVPSGKHVADNGAVIRGRAVIPD